MQTANSSPRAGKAADPLQVQINWRVARGVLPGFEPDADFLRQAVAYRLENGQNPPGVELRIVSWRNPGRQSAALRAPRTGSQTAAWATLGNALRSIIEESTDATLAFSKMTTGRSDDEFEDDEEFYGSEETEEAEELADEITRRPARPKFSELPQATPQRKRAPRHAQTARQTAARKGWKKRKAEKLQRHLRAVKGWKTRRANSAKKRVGRKKLRTRERNRRGK